MMMTELQYARFIIELNGASHKEEVIELWHQQIDDETQSSIPRRMPTESEIDAQINSNVNKFDTDLISFEQTHNILRRRTMQVLQCTAWLLLSSFCLMWSVVLSQLPAG